jgi:hypothetical protein
MDPLLREKHYSFTRLEDSFSHSENQKRFPEDPYVEEENRRLGKKWHEKMAFCREMEEKLDIKIC